MNIPVLQNFKTARFIYRSGVLLLITLAFALGHASATHAQGKWEITPESEQAVEKGLQWLASNQGPEGNWGSNDLGLVATGALAFLSAGHAPGRGEYGTNVQLALDYIIDNAKPSGLLNIADKRRDMYNHGLAAFVLTQAYGVTSDDRMARQLDKALKLIIDAQCKDGGWDYEARAISKGHDLSLVVMQAKALRGAMDIGMELRPETVRRAIVAVRRYYKPTGKPDGKATAYGAPGNPLADRPGQFTYDGRKETLAMAAAGVVCLQEFGEYQDFRIGRSMDVIEKALRDVHEKNRKNRLKKGDLPFDAYTLYYIGQALYQVGEEPWTNHYANLRDAIVNTQTQSNRRDTDGSWNAVKHVSGKTGRLYGTAVGVFVLSIPNRYLPILQRGESPSASDDGVQADAGTNQGAGS